MDRNKFTGNSKNPEDEGQWITASPPRGSEAHNLLAMNVNPSEIKMSIVELRHVESGRAVVCYTGQDRKYYGVYYGYVAFQDDGSLIKGVEDSSFHRPKSNYLTTGIKSRAYNKLEAFIKNGIITEV